MKYTRRLFSLVLAVLFGTMFVNAGTNDTYTQIIQPWMFGHPVQKKTCLWLKGLPNLTPTEICSERQSSKVPGNWFNHGGKERQKNRAKTFPGIAKAMATQWSDYILNGSDQMSLFEEASNG